MTMTDRPVFGELSFYQAMAAALNADEKWAELGKPLTYSMVYAYGAPVDKVFFLNFDEGHIDEVAELKAVDERPADFVISGTPDNWKAILKGEVKPATAMAMGKLKVQGKQTVLLRNMKAFTHIMDVMTGLDPVYP